MNNTRSMKKVSFAFTALLFASVSAYGQVKVNPTNVGATLNGQEINTITTAVPFLTIAPDSRAGGMGDLGAASSPDANSIHWNPAKLAFVEDKVGFSLSYTPWLRSLVTDINLTYLSGFYKLNNKQTFGLSLLYFSLGGITFTDVNGADIGTFQPNEYAIDAAYSQKLGDNASGGIALRYIRSDLTQGFSGSSEPSRAGNAVAADVSFYSRKDVRINKMNAVWAFGANASNIGSKISYTTSGRQDFIPSNLRLGTSLTTSLDKFNTLAVNFDISKLLVPTPRPGVDVSTISVPTGIFKSFNDAPAGFKEEMREIIYSTGVEYWYDKQFALRAGYFHEAATKGNRQFLTLGAGLRYNVFGLDFAYVVPTTSTRSPLENTLRFSLIFNFNNDAKTPTAE